MAGPLQLASIVKTLSTVKNIELSYLRSADGLYAAGSAFAGISTEVNRRKFPEYYAQPGDEGNPTGAASQIRRYASTSKHLATTTTGLIGKDVPYVSSAGKVIDMVNLPLQVANLVDSIQNDHRTSRDVATAVFATAATLSANGGNLLGVTPWGQTPLGKEIKMAAKAGNLFFSSVSILLDDPTIWGKLQEAYKDPSFAHDVKGFAVQSAKDIAQFAASEVKDQVVFTLKALQILPASTASDAQEQAAYQKWLASDAGKQWIADNAKNVADTEKQRIEDTEAFKKVAANMSLILQPAVSTHTATTAKQMPEDTRTIDELKAGALAAIKAGNETVKDVTSAPSPVTKVPVTTSDSSTKAIPTIEPTGRKIPVIYPDSKKIPVIHPDGKKIPVIYPDSVKVKVSSTDSHSSDAQPVNDTRTIDELKQGALAAVKAGSQNISLPKASDLLSDNHSVDSLLGKSSTVVVSSNNTSNTSELSIYQKLAQLYDLHAS